MDLTQPWDSGDVTFIVSGRKIYVSKSILTMHSEVFRAMFTNKKKLTEILLPFQKFGDFLVLMQILHPLPKKGKKKKRNKYICIDDSNLERLLRLAHEYQIQHVVAHCAKMLAAQPPSIHNLILADKFFLSTLRKVFMNHLRKIAHTKLEEDPEFEMLNHGTRVEVLERQSMYRKPSVKNYFLAMKYKEAEVLANCMIYLSDTPELDFRAELVLTSKEILAINPAGSSPSNWTLQEEAAKRAGRQNSSWGHPVVISEHPRIVVRPRDLE